MQRHTSWLPEQDNNWSKNLMRKNQRHATGLYVVPDFAHYKSQAACNELIWKKNLKKPQATSNKQQATSNKRLTKQDYKII